MTDSTLCPKCEAEWIAALMRPGWPDVPADPPELGHYACDTIIDDSGVRQSTACAVRVTQNQIATLTAENKLLAVIVRAVGTGDDAYCFATGLGYSICHHCARRKDKPHEHDCPFGQAEDWVEENPE